MIFAIRIVGQEIPAMNALCTFRKELAIQEGYIRIKRSGSRTRSSSAKCYANAPILNHQSKHT